jgi:hypothetical protein
LVGAKDYSGTAEAAPYTSNLPVDCVRHQRYGRAEMRRRRPPPALIRHLLQDRSGGIR